MILLHSFYSNMVNLSLYSYPLYMLWCLLKLRRMGRLAPFNWLTTPVRWLLASVISTDHADRPRSVLCRFVLKKICAFNGVTLSWLRVLVVVVFFFSFFFFGGGILCIKTDLVPIFFINSANHSPGILEQCYAFSTAPYMMFGKQAMLLLYVVFHCS